MKDNKLKIKSKIFSLVLIFEILFIIFNLSLATSVNAQEISVGIDPSIIQIEATPPSLVKSPISIENQSDQNVTYSIFLVPFKASNLANGEPEFDRGLLEQYKDIFGKIKISDENETLTKAKKGSYAIHSPI
jgi:hypothetical protein